MNLPSFLVIGAMKCGTTTLYHDLLGHPDIFLPEKESNYLTTGNIQTVESYAALYKNAKPGQCCGEFSTQYSMLPAIDGVADHARRLLGDDVKIVYLVREPVSRAISHHYHMHSWHGTGRMEADINSCVQKYPSIIDYSRYSMQLRPWRNAFGDDAIRVIVFEEYIQDRTNTVNNLCKFLGVDPLSKEIDPLKVHNRSDSKPVLNKFWKRVRESALYRHTLKSRIRASWKEKLRRSLLPQAPLRPLPPQQETVRSILEATAEDVDQLTAFLQREISLWEPQQSQVLGRKMSA